MTDRKLPPSASVASALAGVKLHAPAAERNATAIADLLAQYAPQSGTALELASGTGQHVVSFAQRLPQLHWQPTEVAEDRLASIAAYVREADLHNLRPPRFLNAAQQGWGAAHPADLIVLINLTHLISEHETKTILTEVARSLNAGGRFVLYGPFMRNGVLTSDGDTSFHASLTASDPDIGYKNDVTMTEWLEATGLTVEDVIEMPANNLAFIARKTV